MNIDPDDDPEFQAAVRELASYTAIACVVLLAIWCFVFAYLGFYL